MAINLTDSLNAATIKGKLGDAKQVYLNGDTKNLQQAYEEVDTHLDILDNRSSQMEEAIQDISVTGGASTANAVSYDNATSKLGAVTAQGAIDEVSSIGHFAKRGSAINVSTNYNSLNTAEVLTLSQAIAKVPASDRTLGFVGTFLTADGWVSYQFNGDSLTEWSDTSKWSAAGGNITNAKGSSKNHSISQYAATFYLESVMPYVLLPWSGADEMIQIDYPARKVKVNGSYFIAKNKTPYGAIVGNTTTNIGSYETNFIVPASYAESQVWLLAYKVEDKKLYYINYASTPQQMDEDGNVLWYPLAYCNFVDGEFHTNFQGTIYYNGVRYSNTMRDFGNLGGWVPLWENGAPTMKNPTTVLMPSSFVMYNFARRQTVRVLYNKTAESPVNTFSVRYYPAEDREVQISSSSNNIAGLYFLPSNSYNDDYSNPPIVVRGYDGTHWESILPNSGYGEPALLGLYRYGILTTTTTTTVINNDWIEPVSMSFFGTDPKSTIRIDTVAKKVYCTNGNRMFLTRKGSGHLNIIFSEENDNLETDILLHSGSSFLRTQLWYLLYTHEDKKVHLVNYNRLTYFFTPEEDEGLGYDRTKTYLLGAGTFETGAGTFETIGPFMCDDVQYYPSAIDLNSGIQDVALENFPFVNEVFSDNLFNPDTIYAGYAVDGLHFSGSNQYWTSDYIEVTSGKKYKRSSDTDKWVYAYDADKQPVQVVETGTSGIVGQGYAWSGAQFVALDSIPEGVKYVRVIISPQRLNQFMFGLSSADFSSYVPYHKLMFDIQYDPLVNITYTDNIFNKDEVTYNGYWGSSGVTWTPSTTYNTTGFIPVVSGQTYKRVNMITSGYIYPYNASKNPVQLEDGHYWWQELSSQFTIPSGLGIAYVRIVFSVDNDVNTMMIGSNSADFSSYVPYINTKIKEEYLPATTATAVGNALYGKSQVGNLQYEEIGEADYNQVILYGQSLSMGWECPEVITTSAIDGNYMVGNNPLINHGNNHDETLHPLIAVKWTSGGEQPIVGCVNSFSKLYRRFVNKNQMFIGSSAGEGGQSIERLSKECTNASGSVVDNNYYHTEFLRLLDQTKSAVDKESKTVNCSAILYMQGEHNYTGSGLGMTPGTEATKDKDEYKALLMTLKNNMQADIMSKYGQTQKPLFLIYETAGSYINNKEMSINMAQIEFAQENDDVFLLHPTYPTPDYGGGHLSTNGYRWYGELMAKSLYDILVRGEQYNPVFPMNYTVNENQLIIDFYVPVPPLVLDTWTKETITNMGFRVYNSDTEVSITDVAVKGTSVVLTCASTLSGTVEVTYAGQGRSGSGNLRDSDTYHSYYTYFDDRETAPSKRENYTPKDEEGNFIYGKPYPMYNWCANFYHKV